MIKRRQRTTICKSLAGVGYLLVTLIGLHGCAPPHKAEVVERPTKSVRVETEKIGGALIRIVQPGDTLHAIAFANGQNVNDLAAWNEMVDTSKLAVGQRIRLTRPLGFKAKPRLKTKPVDKKPDVNVAVRSAPPENTQSSKSPANNGLPANSAPSLPTSKPVPANRQVAVAGALSAWSWPTKGQLIGRFAVSSGMQGIDIQGQPGQPVVAANRGEVVYVGNGLKGYGNLVIIKHNDQYLSAYAHNRETFVQEGETVNARHVIGAIGVDRKRRNAMHFQIRKNGKPVNPLSYLPAN